MRALCSTGYGLNIRNNLKFIDINLPQPGPNDVVIEIRSAGLNPVDYKIIYGLLLLFSKVLPLPYVVGFDLSGVIVDKGKNVKGLNVGDEVYSKVPWEQIGTVAQKAVVDSNMVALKPSNLTFAEAAGIPLAGCTVFDSFKDAEIGKNTTVLIHAGSGGVGSFAIQYAKYLGAYVYTTTSTKNVEWVKQLGADRVIDYKKEDYRKIAKGVDVIFDTLGGKYTRESTSVVKPSGRIVTIAGHHDAATLSKLKVLPILKLLFKIKGAWLMYLVKSKGITFKHTWSYPNKKTLNYIAALIESNHIKAIVDKEFDFNDAIEALCYVQTNRAKGKVIVNVNTKIS